MKRFARVLSAIALLSAIGCTRRHEITSLQRKEAANLVSEAQFAVTVRDWTRTEGLLTKATALCPDDAEYWLSLGSVRARMKNRDGAKAAYRSALKAYEEAYKKDSKDNELLLHQVYVLALLGEEKDARALLEKIQKKNPDDRAIQGFVREKQLDAMLADPAFREMAL